MKNRNMLTFGLAAGLVALVCTCLVAKDKQSEAADKAKEPATRTQVETTWMVSSPRILRVSRPSLTSSDV